MKLQRTCSGGAWRSTSAKLDSEHAWTVVSGREFLHEHVDSTWRSTLARMLLALRGVGSQTSISGPMGVMYNPVRY